ncbi:MAG: DUF2185 domain-containing protein [Sulfuricurvum sp.]
MGKKFKFNKDEIKSLIPDMGGSIATDTIMVEGLKIGYAYREQPLNDMDNGWRFFSGTESQEYLDDSSKSGVYSLNTIVNYDISIIPYLELPIGTELERVEDSNEFEIYFNE